MALRTGGRVRRLIILYFLIIVSLISTTYILFQSEFWWHCDLKGCNSIHVLQAGRNGSCALPRPVAKSWDTGMVTRLNPHIPADCEKLYNSENDSEILRVQDALSKWRNKISDGSFMAQMENCSHLTSLFEDNFYTSSLETDFPVAFYLTVHDHLQQFMRLLRVIYRPHNVYCIHPDAKSSPTVINSVKALSRCFKNILMPKKLIRVFWKTGESILEAQLACMETLKEAHETWNWNYVMNLCGTELPLVTNRQIVEHLRKLNGSTFIPLSSFPSGMKYYRFGRKYKIDNITNKPYLSDEWFGPPPEGITLYKSLTYNILSYQFAKFVLTHQRALELRKFLKGSGNSEEHFYSSLFMLPEAPIGKHLNSSEQFFLSGSIWEFDKNFKCQSKMRHHVCIFTIADLGNIRNYNSMHPVFFMNKYFYEHDHVVMDCAEKNIVSQNQLEYERDCTCIL